MECDGEESEGEDVPCTPPTDPGTTQWLWKPPAAAAGAGDSDSDTSSEPAPAPPSAPPQTATPPSAAAAGPQWDLGAPQEHSPRSGAGSNDAEGGRGKKAAPSRLAGLRGMLRGGDAAGKAAAPSSATTTKQKFLGEIGALKSKAAAKASGLLDSTQRAAALLRHTAFTSAPKPSDACVLFVSDKLSDGTPLPLHLRRVRGANKALYVAHRDACHAPVLAHSHQTCHLLHARTRAAKAHVDKSAAALDKTVQSLTTLQTALAEALAAAPRYSLR